MNALFIPIVLFGGAFIVAILSKTFAHVVCHWRDASLKTSMVEAGYSAAEIERVIAARCDKTSTTELDVPAVRKPPLNKKMVS